MCSRFVKYLDLIIFPTRSLFFTQQTKHEATWVDATCDIELYCTVGFLRQTISVKKTLCHTTLKWVRLRTQSIPSGSGPSAYLDHSAQRGTNSSGKEMITNMIQSNCKKREKKSAWWARSISRIVGRRSFSFISKVWPHLMPGQTLRVIHHLRYGAVIEGGNY